MSGTRGGIRRSVAFALLALPLAFARVRTRLRVPRRLLREPVTAHDVSLPRCLIHSVLSAGIGLLCWFLVLLSALVLVRGLAYPLVSGGYENAWGGPTLAGSWLVHAALGLLIAPGLLGLVAWSGRLQLRLTRKVLGRVGPWWTVPAGVMFAVLGAVFFVAWTQQL
ncbi:hypothetical protein [Nocardia mangyaensis]|uniref:hypothetical protein n=1 Tax=Nocardia mangyaensis TaxID=2213200 RepID=UPI002676A879|nr:hypothetical protein [Nocardia mangyaensis]MDO3649590.1 hypothetical protein [Nocardia mangyaensis]